MAGLATPAVVSLWDRLDGLRTGERASVLFAVAEPGAALERRGDVSLADRDARLMALYASHFGDALDATASCARCAEQVDITLSLAALLPSVAQTRPALSTISADGFDVTVRGLRANDLAGLPNVLDAAIAVALERCIVAATLDGRAVSFAELPAELLSRIATACETLDAGSDTYLRFACAVCDAPNTIAFDITVFLSAAFGRVARTALLDVHALATAYGWTEGDVFALSDARRRRYVDLAAG